MDISILATRRPRFQCKPREAFSATCGGPLRRIPPSRAMLSGCIARRVAKRSCNASAVPDRQEDPAVSEGACAQALCAHPHELLSVAVARLIFRTRLAPGLIVTTLRYVLRAAGLSAEHFLDPLVANHLLPPTDHLASLPRLLATLSTRYSTALEGQAVLTDDHLFRLVRVAFLGYNYKSVGYRQALGASRMLLQVHLTHMFTRIPTSLELLPHALYTSSLTHCTHPIHLYPSCPCLPLAS